MKTPSIENFLEFEREYKCNSIQAMGIPVWTLYRYEIHNTIKKHTVGREEGSQTPFSQKELWAMALNAIKPLPNKKVDVLFVADGRRNRNIDTGVYENIFFDEVSKRFNSLLVEHPDNHTHLQPNGMDNVYFTDRVAFKTNLAVKLANKFNTKKKQAYTKAVIESYGKIFDAIKDTFGTDIKEELIYGFVERMYYFEITKKYCSKILDRVQPKLIMELCYYSMESFAYSALGKERGIPTAEYAHGFAFPTHTPMQFNQDEKNITVLPDAHLTFSKTQESVVHFPSDVKIVTVGFPFFEREREKYKAKFPRDEKTICFVSTLAEGEQISKIAVEVADQLGDEYNIVYKLHPKEFSYYKEKFPWLVGSKLTVIDNNENHMFKFLAESSTIVCTRTASLQEGIGFGCKVILLNYGDTAINLKDLIEKENLPLVKSADEVVAVIKNDAAGFVKPDGMYEPNALENICNYINEVINK